MGSRAAPSGNGPLIQDGASIVLLDRLLDDLLRGVDPACEVPLEFRGRQFDLGLGWVWFPEGRGGLGLSPQLQSVVDQRLAAAGAPAAPIQTMIGHGMGAPTVLAHGTPEQCDRFLRPLFTGEEIWCQLFSEPGSGSDVASLATRAQLDGDEWIVSGQKVWTTVAHLSRWGMLAARTDPDAPKHKGMTYFIVDMHSPGVDVRPLFQLTGDAEFNEVFLADVRIPDSQRLGDVGDGWRVALTTLMNERVALGGGSPARGSGLIGDAVEAWVGAGRPTRSLDRLMQLWVDAEAVRLTALRARQLRVAGTPGPEGSIGKLLSTELSKALSSFVIDLLGADGMLHLQGYPMERSAPSGRPTPQHVFLRARANSIEGGTSEIMRNILGERVLGLPGDLRTDKDAPWSEVPRS